MKLKIYTVLMFGMLVLSVHDTYAQKEFFLKINKVENVNGKNPNDTTHLRSFVIYQINEVGLRNHLLPAPMEFKNKNSKGIEIEVPLPNDVVEVFNLFESPILSPEIAQKHPEIKTYAGTGIQHKNYIIRINLTSEGFSAIILGVNGDAVYFEKLDKNINNQLYKSYFSKDAISPKNITPKNLNNRCGTLINESFLQRIKANKGNNTITNFSSGNELKTFRLAIAADGEFTAQKGGTQASAFAAVTNYVNNLNAVYRNELSVAFSLVTDQNLVYTNAATDPYTNDNQSTMLDENQTNLDNTIGNAAYDIGHVLGYAGSSGGGIASSPSICESLYKGQGVSGVGDGSWPEVFDFQLIAHEVGHQFGMSHSYNSNVPVCTTRELSTSVEPGSGTTIMSYGYTCTNSDPGQGLVGEDDYEYPLYGPFLNFHVVNIQQAINTIANVSCYTTTATGDAIPVINAMGSNFTIPKSTPFSLFGSATDADPSNDLSYSWEGTNISDEPVNANLTATTISDPTKPPFFRSYPPLVTSQVSNPGLRNYPRLSAILNGSNYAKGDKLPSIGITTTHTLTVRDNAGAVTTHDVTVIIDGTSGPFLITNDPTGNHTAGEVLNVTWSINNTNASPVNCTLVDIFLSTDGGQTFPTTLANALPNNGSASITLPNTNTTLARLKIAPSSSTASGNTPNIFFDISNADFVIGTVTPVTWLSFDAKIINHNDALLTWETAQEINNKGYDIEISQDAITYSKLGFVNGVGNTTLKQHYQYPVYNLKNGDYYFRLKQLDFDGRYNYSKIANVTIAGSIQSAYIYPNPTNTNVNIYPGIHTGKIFSIKIIDQVGKEILIIPAKKYNSLVNLNIDFLAKGVYHIILEGFDFSETLKLIKL